MASLTLYVLTYNCGRTLVDVDAFSTILLNGTNGTLPDLIFISLQEIAPIYASFIGGSFLVPHFNRVKDAVDKAAKALGGSYHPVVSRHVGMTALICLARDPACIESVETAGVGVGVAEMGNKGAVGLRLLYKDGRGSTELTFVAAHLAAMESEIKRRNEDWKNIVRGLVFSSTSEERAQSASLSSRNGEPDDDAQPLLNISPQNAGIYKPTSHLFLAGDLNYRTSSIKPGPDDHHRAFPQPNQEPSSPKHVKTLYEGDQLNQERAAGRTCHGLVEPPVNFPPTYKYTSDEPYLMPDEELQKWNWAEHRWPSWCDRILYLELPEWLKETRKIVSKRYIALPLMATSDHRPVASLFEIPLISIPAPSEEDDGSSDPRIRSPFNIDPNWRLRRSKARQLELVVGFGAYFTTTWEGGAVALATIIGVIGGYFVLKALLNF